MSMEENEEQFEEELYEHKRITVDPGQAVLRVDKFLTIRLEKTSRNRIQKAADAGCLQVNGVAVKSNYKVKPGDVVSLVFPTPPQDHSLEPEDIPLDVLYQDDHLLVINKPAGMVVHPGVGNYSGTLVNALLHHVRHLPGGDEQRPGLVHRLDKDTSGVMVIARTEEAMTHLAAQFFHRTIQRRYLALCWGLPDPDNGTITGNIGRDQNNRQLYKVYPEGDFGKHAVTHYETIEPLGFVSLIRCRLETGRTHQIRVHLKFKGHPLFNDPFYGGDRILRGVDTTKYKQFIKNCLALIPGQALHAESLAFVHPATGEEMSFKTDPPPGFVEILEKWRRYLAGRTQGVEKEEEET